MSTSTVLLALAERRLSREGRAWLERAGSEIAGGVGDERFCALFSAASRHAPRADLAPTRPEREQAAAALEGWDPERWTVLEALRAALLALRPDREGAGEVASLEECFRYADLGELVALYRSLAHLSEPARFAWRGGEGARSNMRAVFEATCCDTPYPARWFDDLAWRQAVVKALFIGAPLWRFWNLDGRLDAELARMALDLADERRSAGREVNPELWMCLGSHGGQRGLVSLDRELARGSPRGRASAALALARAGQLDRLRSLAALESHPVVRDTMVSALEGRSGSGAWRQLDPATARA